MSFSLSLAEPSSLTVPLSDAEDIYELALSSNGAWAGHKAHQSPDFFPKLASGQSPQIRKPAFLLLIMLIPGLSPPSTEKKS